MSNVEKFVDGSRDQGSCDSARQGIWSNDHLREPFGEITGGAEERPASQG